MGFNRKDKGANRIEKLNKLERTHLVRAKCQNLVAEEALNRSMTSLKQQSRTNLEELRKRNYLIGDDLSRIKVATDRFRDGEPSLNLRDRLMLKKNIPPVKPAVSKSAQVLTPKACRYQPSTANVIVYSKNEIPLRKAKLFKPQKVIQHSDAVNGAILLSKRYITKLEGKKKRDAERARGFLPTPPTSSRMPTRQPSRQPTRLTNRSLSFAKDNTMASRSASRVSIKHEGRKFSMRGGDDGILKKLNSERDVDIDSNDGANAAGLPRPISIEVVDDANETVFSSTYSQPTMGYIPMQPEVFKRRYSNLVKGVIDPDMVKSLRAKG